MEKAGFAFEGNFDRAGDHHALDCYRLGLTHQPATQAERRRRASAAWDRDTWQW
jgi:hypothetical protein